MENRKWKFGRKLHGVFFEMGVIMAAVAYMMIASSFFILFSGQFPMLSAGRTANEAQALAELEANVLKLVSYDELDGAKHDRQAVKFDGWDGWESEIKIGDEMKVNNDDDSLLRIATISIFKNNDTLSRYSMQIPLSDAAGGGSGAPDYSKGEVIHTGFKAPRNGWVLFREAGDDGTRAMYVNGTTVAEYTCSTYHYEYVKTTYFIPVKKGDVITMYSNGGGYYNDAEGWGTAIARGIFFPSK